MKWIKCEERLPMMGMPVLAICRDRSPEQIPHVVYRANGVDAWRWCELHLVHEYDEGAAVFTEWMNIDDLVNP